MGFAGQVFAARVAVGLAMPSPKAFSKAGQAIGGFASKMYSRLNKTSMQSASRNLETQKKNLAGANSALQSHVKKQSSYVEAGTNQQLARIKKLYGDVGKAAMGSSKSMKGLKATMGSSKSAGKLFGNLSKDMKDAGDYAKMMKNFSKLQKEERAEVFATFEARKKAHLRLINTSKKREELGKDKVQQIRDEIAVLQSQEDEFKGFDKSRTSADDKYNRKKRKHLADVKEYTEAVSKAQKELVEAEKGQLVVQEHLIRSGNDMAVAMKQNFVDAVRESVSALTALYYKLEQNSSQLIEFERELMNANSVFRVTNDELFNVGNQVVQFGQEFGMEMQNGATGLYQLASAGLSANDAMTVLGDTLKLSMAVQGDHNTISKLVTQTLFGFEMEMNQAGLVADKFAYAIQKSLIEYQDLASAVKFALPFFTSTGQSIDQLLGALQVLTNRALEAGIAGRGLRQGVAELAESIGDATANFHALGVEVVDAEGNMLQLTEIAANFHAVLEEGVINDTELLTTLIQDLNVRGATAFVHLVQASDEFTEAVEATTNAGGELDKMVEMQNMSIASQIQILRNNVAMMSLYKDVTYEGTGYMNAFHEAVSKMTQSMRGLLVVETEGTYQLSAFGKSLEAFAIKGVKELQGVLDNVLPLAERFLELSKLGIQVLRVYLIPVKMIVKALQVMGPEMTKMLLSFHLLNKILPISALVQYGFNLAMLDSTRATTANIGAQMTNTIATNSYKNALITSWFYQKLRNKETYIGIMLSLRQIAVDKITIPLVEYLQWLTGRRIIAEAHLWSIEKAGLRTNLLLIKTAIVKTYVQTKNYILAGLRLIMTKALLKHQIHVLRVGLSKNKMLNFQGHLERMSMLTMIKTYILSKAQLLLEIARNAMYSITINIKIILNWLGLVTIHQGEMDYQISQKRYALQLKDFVMGQMELAQTKLKLMWDNLINAVTWKNIWAKITELGVDEKSNSQKAYANWLRTQEFFLKVRDTLWTWLGVAADWAKYLGELLWVTFQKVMVFAVYIILYAVKVINIAITYIQAQATTVTVLADIRSLIVKIAKNIVLAIATVIMIAYTVVQWLASAASWSFTLSLLMNPVVLIVVGVIALVVGLVMLVKWLTNAGDMWTVFGMIASHTLGAIMWPFKVIGGLLMKMGEAVYAVLEGPLFKLGLFLGHLFKMLLYYVKLVGAWFMEKIINPVVAGFKWIWGILKEYVIDPIIGFFVGIKEKIETLRNPLITMGAIFMKVVNPIFDLFSKIWGFVKSIVGGIASIGGDAMGWLSDKFSGKAEGGYVQPMANGGAARANGPYLIGEKGPELFMPRGPGKIIPNKDLNSQRVRNMLSDNGYSGAGADKAFQQSVGNMHVDTLEVRRANLRESKIGVDTFGGNI